VGDPHRPVLGRADQLRAVLITLHILAISLLAIPAPVGLSHAAMQEAGVQESLATARTVAGALGWEVDQAEATALAHDLGSRYLDARHRVLTPVRPYAQYLGVKQGWRMFSQINPAPRRLEIDLFEGGIWRPIYVARDPELAWMADLMDHERMRGFTNAFSWGKQRPRFRRFSAWLASRAAADFPEATKLKTRMVTVHLVGPEALADHGSLPTGATSWETRINLAPLREGSP